jgi:polar amino acid transport system ATP-binding protein
MSDPIISVDAIVKRFGKRVVIDSISFDIAEGGVVALVGPSGGGKSTLLRCLVGLEPFEGGSVRVADAALRPGPLRANPAELRKLHLRTGMVFQTWNLFPHMTALENVIEAPVHVAGIPRAKAVERATALLDEVGLAHRASAMPRSMSGGEQQRCAIARALAMEPRVLFMDEPTSALDPRRVGDLVELLRELRTKEKLTLVIVTHEMSFATRLADRVLVLYEGKVVEDGPPREVLASPRDPRTRTFLGLEAEAT